MKRNKVATVQAPASVTVYTVGGSIRNRTAHIRGRNSAQDWRAYEYCETETETETRI